MALLLSAGANAGWLFFTLTRAGLQFRDADKSALDGAETGRVLAGVLAQPGFLLVFAFGLVVGPLCAWLLIRRARGLGSLSTSGRVTIAALLLASSVGVVQLVMARQLADVAIERTGALVSKDPMRAEQARGELDMLHRWSERLYGLQIVLVAVALGLLWRPGPRTDEPRTA